MNYCSFTQYGPGRLVGIYVERQGGPLLLSCHGRRFRVSHIRFDVIDPATPEQHPGLYEIEPRLELSHPLGEGCQPPGQRRQLAALPEDDIGDVLDDASRSLPLLPG